MILVKLQSGLYKPSYPIDSEESARIAVGEEVRATRNRNIMFLRKFFALISLGFENQNKYTDKEIYRMVLTLKAGFVHYVEGTDGKIYPMPKSIAMDKMTAEEFETLYTTIKTIIATDCKMTAPEVEKEIQNYF